jgi:hypothetical protein
VARGRLRNAAPKVPDCLAQVFEARATGCRRHADQFARESGDLATLGVPMPDRRGIPRGVDLRWRRYGRILLAAADRPDETIAAAGHGLDPAVPAGRVAQRPTQCRNLHGEIAILDRLAGPCGLDQRVFRNQCAGPFNHCFQQSNRSPPERYGLAAIEQHAVMLVQAKWTQRIDVCHVSIVNPI